MIVIDNFVQDPELLKAIADDPSFFETGFSWWSGWWNTPGQSLRHRLIEYIWRYNTPSQYSGVTIAGFEHWTGTYDGSDQSHKFDESVHGITGKNTMFSLRHHMDKDEHRWKNHGEIVTPGIGTIFYPVDHTCTGGKLRIYDVTNMTYCTEDNYELIEPKFNRLIIFDPAKIHAVEEVTSGIRRAIAINLWTEKLSDGQLADMNEIL